MNIKLTMVKNFNMVRMYLDQSRKNMEQLDKSITIIGVHFERAGLRRI